MNLKSLVVGIVLLASVGGECAPVQKVVYPDDAGRKRIDAIVDGWRAVRPAKPRRVLLVSKCFGYVHADAIGHGYYAFRAAGERTGAFTVDVAGDFVPLCDLSFLARYDAVLLNSGTGVKAKEHPGLEGSLTAFVRNGGGLCLIHAGLDAFFDSPAIQEMNGGLFWGHPWGAYKDSVTWLFRNEEPDHPVVASFKPLGASYRMSDEIYMHCSPPYRRAGLRVLQSLDLSDGPTRAALDRWKGRKRADGDYAVTWVRPYGKGRVFYTSYGHDRRSFLDPVRLQLMLNGLQYALGDLKAPDAPRP